MIQEQLQTSESHEKKTRLGLTVEESFFIELMEKQEPSVINAKFTKEGSQLIQVEQFKNYYSEPEIIQLLESLVVKGRIQKKEKGVVLLCPKCGGHAIMTLLICPKCGSVKVGKREDLYHAECEYWSPREEFIEGLLLRCPRCNELLDEDAPEGTPGFYSVSDSHFECQDCGTSVSKNNLKMVCVKCSTKFTSIQASYLNSASYVLVPEGEVVLPQRKQVKQRTHPIEKPVISEPKKPEKPEQSLPVQIEPVPQQEKEPEAQPDSVQESPPEIKPEPEPEKKQEISHVVKPEIKTEIVSEPEEVKEDKPKQEILQKSIERFSKLLNPKKKKKRKKKLKPNEKTVEKPVEEPLEDSQETIQEEPLEEIQDEPEEPVVIEEEKPVEPLAQKVLMIVENVTVSEFIIEALEEVKTPIEVLHVDDGRAALKELRNKYDVVIMDLDLKTIEFKLILKEMEKWEIMTPIIAFSDEDHKIEKYSLNVHATLKKKQKEYKKIKKTLKKINNKS